MAMANDREKGTGPGTRPKGTDIYVLCSLDMGTGHPIN